jgi:hypothetical protein
MIKATVVIDWDMDTYKYSETFSGFGMEWFGKLFFVVSDILVA